eukprot:1115936-Pyramimonas_sp.AAC.1
MRKPRCGPLVGASAEEQVLDTVVLLDIVLVALASQLALMLRVVSMLALEVVLDILALLVLVVLVCGVALDTLALFVVVVL